MDKNSVFGIVIIAAILIIWGIVQAPDKKERAERQRIADSLAALPKKEALVIDTVRSTAGNTAPIKENVVTDTTSARNTYGDFSLAAFGEDEFFTIENDLIKLVVSSKGGRPYSVELKKYKTYDRKPVVLFNGD